MANAYRDQNNVTTLIASSNGDGFTPVRVYADPVTHRLLVDAGGSSSGITSINADTTAAQTLTVGSTGSDFAIVDNGTGDHKFNLPTASHTARGALSSADWDTFNGKQAAGSYITALTGDVTATGPGSVAATLATVNGNVGSFTNASITVNGKGLITAASSGSSSSGTVTTVSVATANGFAGTVANATTTPAITLTTSVTGVLSGNGTTISAATTTGSGAVVLANTPTLITPALGVASATSLGVAGIITTGLNGGVAGDITFNGSTSGSTVLKVGTVASGTLSLPAATDTLIGKATTDTLTNKTYDTAGTGNSFSINGLAATANTGTGAVVRAAKPTFVGTIQTVTAMGAQALDGSLGNVFTRTLAGNETFTQSNFSTGQCFMVEVTNAAGGGDTVTWFSTVTWVTVGATAPVQAAGASAVTTYGFRCTGSNTFLGYVIGTQ